jgi:hypothetical protein
MPVVETRYTVDGAVCVGPPPVPFAKVTCCVEVDAFGVGV